MKPQESENRQGSSIVHRRALIAMGAAAGAAVASRAFWSPASTADERMSADGSAVMTAGARYSDHLPDVVLQTQSGESVRFCEDLIRDHRVLISFMYIRCNGICPATSALFHKMRGPLLKEFGDTVRCISITLDPEHDTPDKLQEYAAAFRAGDEKNPPSGLAPWYFLTGSRENVESLRSALGYTDPDPKINEDRTQHAGLFTCGNDVTNRWCTFPTGLIFEQSLAGVVRTLGVSPRHRYGFLPRPS